MNWNSSVRFVCLTAVLSACLVVNSRPVMAAQLPNTTNPPTVESPPLIDVTFRPDLNYRTVDGKPLMLDLVGPKSGEGPFPAVIILHGVGPANKGKKGMLAIAQELARRGYMGIPVSYRSKPEDAFPAPIQDVCSAICWIRARAEELKIDKNRIGVLGFSGGGTLACLLGLKGDGLEGKDQRENSSLVQAVVSFYGPTDFTRLHESCTRRAKANEGGLGDRIVSGLIMQALEKWLGGPPAKVSERYALASPLSYATKNSPPILLIHGADDSVVPVDQSKLLETKLRESGRPVSLIVVGGAGHDFEEKNKTNRHMALAAVLAFLDDHLLAPHPNPPHLGEGRVGGPAQNVNDQ
jgi:acetyl esterase/lipase